MNGSQSSHPDELSLEAYVDGTASDPERKVVADHVERCAQCAEYVRRVRSLSRDLRALPTTARSVPPLDAELTRRASVSERGAPWRNLSPLMAAAVAAVIFGAGVAAGTVIRRPSGAAEPPPTELRPALDVQQAGTSYIAALVRLNAAARGNDAGALYGREVALATLYGAAAEAVAPLGADASASELVELARAMRNRVAQSSPTERMHE
jgi:predicted anti-sigma-YlaC factor YlaD